MKRKIKIWDLKAALEQRTSASSLCIQTLIVSRISNFLQIRHFAKKKLFIGSRSWVTPRPKPETKINFGLDPEFNSIHVGIKINKCLKFLTFGSRKVRKI